jgi:hypothetical protein
MDTHHTYDRIFGVVVNKDRFDINVPVGHGNSQVIMERPIVPLGPLFRYLINLAACFLGNKVRSLGQYRTSQV